MKINIPRPISKFWGWSGFISMPNFRPFCTCILKKTPSNLTAFTESKWWRKEENQQTMSKILFILKVVGIYQYTKFQAFSLMCPKENARKPQISPVSLSHRKISIPSVKSIWFWRWLWYFNMPNVKPFLPCVINIMPGNLSGWTDGKSVDWSVIRAMVIPPVRWKDGWTGNPKNNVSSA